MRKILSVVVVSLVGLVAGVALAQKTVTLPKAVEISKVELAPVSDGDGGTAIEITVYAESSASGVSVGRPAVCTSSNLTAAQKTAISTIRTTAINCFNSEHGL